ncbi:hypothetical protein M885DRAFT_560245 [Pelagophyceae sp. CCMP2097]|nr:hypothetical protein M885DRAFT_560245 [Pelagophyceae sp. CCMP2097]
MAAVAPPVDAPQVSRPLSGLRASPPVDAPPLAGSGLRGADVARAASGMSCGSADGIAGLRSADGIAGLRLAPATDAVSLALKRDTVVVFVDVTLESSKGDLVGLRVVRGRHWRAQWRDDSHGCGTIIGFLDSGGALRGRQTVTRKYADMFHTPQDKHCGPGHQPQGPGWCAVRWDVSDKEALYPIGATGPLGEWWTGGQCYALALAPEGSPPDPHPAPTPRSASLASPSSNALTPGPWSEDEDKTGEVQAAGLATDR